MATTTFGKPNSRANIAAQEATELQIAQAHEIVERLQLEEAMLPAVLLALALNKNGYHSQPN